MAMTDGTVYRFITDHLGSVRLVVNAETGQVVRRMLTAYRSAIRIPVAVAVGGLLLGACDGSLTVSGQLEAESCELSLWALRGPVWADTKPTKVRAANVGETFDVHWTISGPRTEHWVEVACVGYRAFRSPRFQAPSPNPTLKLGKVRLEPQGNPAPPTPHHND